MAARKPPAEPEPTVPPAPADGGDGDEPVVEESRVREIVRDVLSELGIGGGGEGGEAGGETGDGDGDAPPAAGRRTQAAVEDDVESKVRAAIGKLRTEEDRDSRLSALEEKVAKEPERPPVKERKSTRVMGWNRRVG